MIGEDVIDFYVKVKEDEHMLSPELKKLLNDLQTGGSNIRIDREKIQAELEALDNTPVFLKHTKDNSAIHKKVQNLLINSNYSSYPLLEYDDILEAWVYVNTTENIC